ncbi:MAG: DUF805 domain-containing protein [Opitutales bacterium]
MKESFFSSAGRLGRLGLLLRLLLLCAIWGGITYGVMRYFGHHFHEGEFHTLGIFISIVAAVFCGLTALMQVLKRLRDIGKEAYLSVLLALPVVNALFLLYLLLAPSLQ